MLHILKENADRTVVGAASIAEQVGNSKTMNIVLFGALIKAMELNGIDWEAVIKGNVKEKLAEVNIKAFSAGMISVI